MKNDIPENYINSLETAKKAVPDISFVSKMEDLALAFIRKEKRVSKMNLFLIAASFALLLMSNIFIYNNASSQYDYSYSELDIASDYNLVPVKSLLNE